MRYKAIAISFTLACCLAFAFAYQDPPKSEGKDVSLTGCLQAGAQPDTFVLKNVTAQAAAGQATPTELAKADPEYKLTAEATVNLKDHVGHKVEVSGKIEGKKGSQPGQAANFKVKSIKHISPNCP